jgi:hypothetical protein
MLLVNTAVPTTDPTRPPFRTFVLSVTSDRVPGIIVVFVAVFVCPFVFVYVHTVVSVVVALAVVFVAALMQRTSRRLLARARVFSFDFEQTLVASRRARVFALFGQH